MNDSSVHPHANENETRYVVPIVLDQSSSDAFACAAYEKVRADLQATLGPDVLVKIITPDEATQMEKDRFELLASQAVQCREQLNRLIEQAASLGEEARKIIRDILQI